MKSTGARILLVTALTGAGLAVLPAPAQAATVQATLVKTTWTGGPNSNWAHPSPDPSGITYNSRTGQLLISDGEVEETGSAYPKNVWKETNLYVASLQGSLLETGANTTAYSNEPVGVAFRPGTTADSPERLYVSDDNADRVFEVEHGVDGRYGTADDKHTFFSSRFTGSYKDDAEDVAVVSTRAGELLIIDGYKQEVYVYFWGENKTFDGLPSAGGDDTVRQFDVRAQGALDPEGIVYNAYRNTLFVLDDPSNRIYEFNLQGGLENVVTLDFTLKSGAGITLAPPSDGSGPPNAYIVDRGVDNDSNQDTFNDGRLYEVAIPELTGGTGGGGTVNEPPVVSAGADTGGVVSAQVALAGSVTDPEKQPVTAAWSPVSGPAGGTVVFADQKAAGTSATFSVAGDYVLRLTGSDGVSTRVDDVLVRVTAEATTDPTPTGSGKVEVPVRAGADDAEQKGTSTSLTSSDLELVTDGSAQTVGLRFTGVAVPKGATITKAYVQFQADEASTGTMNLTVRGQAVGNAPVFTTASNDISSRTPTGAGVGWAPQAWGSVGERGLNQQTSDLAPVVQEIVSRGDWASGNALALIITGTGKRVAEAYEGGAAKAPVLHIEYGASAPTNQTNASPVADAGADQTVVSTAGGGTPTPGLPGSLTGVMPEAHGHIGPYKDSNGNLYTVIESDLANGNDPMAMKSSDGGATWAEIDRAGRTTTGDLEADWAVQIGSRIYFAWQKSSGQVHLAAFNTSDAPTGADTWAIKLETIYGSGDPADQWVSLSPLSNGDLWAFYSIAPPSGKSHQAAFRKRSATGTLGAQVVLDPNRAVSEVVAVQGTDDVTHVFYKDQANKQVFYRSLTADGVLSAAVRVDTGGTSTVHAPMTNAVVTRVDGTDRVTVAWADGAGTLQAGGVDGNGAALPPQKLSDVPVAINPGSTGNKGAVAHLAADGSTVHALYADQATQDIWYDRSADGGAWGVDVEIVDGLQTQWLTGLIAFTNRGGLPVLGYIYDTGPHGDDGGIIRYGEHPLGPGSGMSTTLNGSVDDDGLPNGTLTSAWTLVSSDTGGQANFQQPTSPVTSVTFTKPGRYVLRLTADDSQLTGTDEVTVAVQ